MPGEGLGGTTVEHWIPRTADASLENHYDNCVYACRFCNRSRSVAAILQDDARLLDPTQRAWSEHFSAVDDRLRPTAGDADAEYTHGAYALDDPRKVERRRARRELVSDRLLLLQKLSGELVELVKLAETVGRRDPRRAGEILEGIKRLREYSRRALADLGRYSIIPRDAPSSCRCPSSEGYSLPEGLERQSVEIPDSTS